eukprot:5792479-Lingulodinium_polyedra.AAC.1
MSANTGRPLIALRVWRIVTTKSSGLCNTLHCAHFAEMTENLWSRTSWECPSSPDPSCTCRAMP